MDNNRRDFTSLSDNQYQNQLQSSIGQTFIQPPNQNIVLTNDYSAQNPMTFRQFTLTQSDNLSPNELIEMYDSYKTKHVQKNKSEFINSNKSSPFILEKFHPIWIRNIIEKRRNLVIKRIDWFLSKLVSGNFNSINRAAFFNNDSEYISNSSEREEINNSDNITVLEEPYFEANMNSHILLLTDIPVYISQIDVFIYFTSKFPFPDGTFGECNGFLDLSFSTPKFNRGVLVRQCYILFDNKENRDCAFERIKGKTIKSSFTTQKTSEHSSELNNYYDMQDRYNMVGQHGFNNLIYIIQAKLFNDNVPTRFGTLPKIFSTNEQLCSDKKNMIMIIEKMEKDQGIELKINKAIDSIVEKESLDIRKVVDILTVYLRFVHGIDYYTFTVAKLFQNQIENHFNVAESSNHSDNLDPISSTHEPDSTILQSKHESFSLHRSLLLLTRGYIETIMRNRFKGGWLRNEALDSETQTYDNLLENHQSKSALAQLNKNVEGLLNLPSIFKLIPETVHDDDKVLLFNWKRYCEQNTIRKKSDRWQCGICLKQFKGEDFVSKHLDKKHKDFIEVIKDQLNFERVIKPLSDKFSYLIYPNFDDSISNSVRRGNYLFNTSGPIRFKYKYHRSMPYERNNHFRDWDTPKQNLSFQNRNNCQFNIRTTIKYDDL